MCQELPSVASLACGGTQALSIDDSDPRGIQTRLDLVSCQWRNEARRSDCMRVELLSALIFALGAGAGQSVFAADIPVKAPVYKAAPVQNDWTGPYVGFALGGKWTDAKWTTTQLTDPPATAVGTAIDGSSPDRFNPAGLRLGGYAGYNWQMGRWLYGLEIDAAWSNATDTHKGVPGCEIVCNPGFPGPGLDSSFIRTLWDASLRPRVGYLVMPEMLVYGTAGVALQRIEVSGTCANTFADPLCLFSPPFAVKTQNRRSHSDRLDHRRWHRA